MIYLEVFAMITGVLGTIIAAFKVEQMKYSWVCWLLSLFVSSFVFYVTSKYALLSLNVISIIINFFGAYNYFKKSKSEDVQKNAKIIEFLSKALVALGLGILIYSFSIFKTVNLSFIYMGAPTLIEWAVFALNLGAISAAASKSEYSKYCWIWWVVSNSLFAYVMIKSNMYGIAGQQVMYVALSLYGIYTWWFKNKSVK